MFHSAYVTTIIAPEGKHKLQTGDIDTIKIALHSNQVSWLAEGIACDIFHDNPADTPPQLNGVDIVSQLNKHRKKKLLISDMDSTLIEQECIDELADYLGIKDRVSHITERAMNGDLDFKEALRERVALLKDLPQSALQEVYDNRITIMNGARTLLATMKAHNAHCVLVSGGFTFFTQRIKDELGFDADESNQLDFADGALTGRVIEPILDKEAKLESLQRHCAQQSLELSKSIAVGDGANDLPMLQAAGLGVAYRAKPVVQSQTNAAINHGDLSALLYLQGYPKSEWVF